MDYVAMWRLVEYDLWDQQ